MRRLLGVLALALALPAAPAHADVGSPQVIVVGVPGLRWSDINAFDTPALDRLAHAGSAGLLSVRTDATLDCPADGWLTLGAGNRVVAAGPSIPRCAATLPPAASLPAQVAANRDRPEGAVPGLLENTLRAAGRCASARGPGAPLAAAAADGALAAGPCAVLLVGTAPVSGTSPERARAAAAADTVVASADRHRAVGSTLLVVGLSEGPGDADPHLHVALAAGPHFGAGALISASTRRAPYVQLVDVAPTVLSLLAVPVPSAMIGQPWRSTGSSPGLAALTDGSRKAAADRAVTVPFFVVLVAIQLALVGPALWRRWWRLAEVVSLAGVSAVGASYLANLVPWWRAQLPFVALVGAVGAGTVVLTAAAMIGRGRLARAGLACGATAAILVIDLLTGAHLQMSSVAGYSPLVAGRFAGIGNVAFGVLAAAVLLAAASTRRATIAALTGLVVVVDGAPPWGSDVGGVLALVPAYTLLVLLLAGWRVNLTRLALAALGGVAVVAAFGVADHARPAAQQTHLGRFVGQVLDGTAGGVLRRKAEANVALLFHSPVTALLPVVVAALLVVFLRPPARLGALFAQSPAWRSGLLAVLTAAGLGFLLNDSGAAVPALAILVAVPATIAVLARHAGEPAPDR